MTAQPSSAPAHSPSPADERPVAEARALVERAHAAFLKYQHFTQQQVDRIIDAMAAAATANAERLAQLAVEETGFGVVADKKVKNLFSSERVYQAIRGMKTVGIVNEDRARGVVEIAVPVGVVAAILPTTNPTSTAIYKILIALKGRNAIVLSPHPAAFRCTCAATTLMRDAAIQAGAPEDVICCFQTPTLAGTQELMRHRRTSVILATGGMAMVRAAYTSGKPAYGVGPGNVPAFIDRTADVKKAVADIVRGTTFDNGTICSSEQAIVAEESIREAVLGELRANSAHFLTADEMRRLGEQMVDVEKHTINPKFVGRSAVQVAEIAGLHVSPATRVLIAELQGVGRDFPLSAEKLSPVLALYFTRDRTSAIDVCEKLLRFGGLGHTAAVHTKDDAVAREYGLRMPAGRIVVNSPAPLGSIGATTNLFPAMTLGCGAVGGNITSDNIGPMHLVNLRRVGWEQAGLAVGKPQLDAPAASCSASAASPADCGCSTPAAKPEPDLPVDQRVAVSRAIDRFLQARGSEPRPAAAPQPAQKSAEKPPLPALPKPKPRPVDFVSEAEVRAAVRAKEKIVVGARTLITPAARDLGAEYDIFLKTD